MTYAFVARERAHYPIKTLCRVLQMSVSGFYASLKREAQSKADPDAQVRHDLRDIHEGSQCTYGRSRMVRALRACAHQLGHQARCPPDARS